jgi:hypothetical protein
MRSGYFRCRSTACGRPAVVAARRRRSAGRRRGSACRCSDGTVRPAGGVQLSLHSDQRARCTPRSSNACAYHVAASSPWRSESASPSTSTAPKTGPSAGRCPVRRCGGCCPSVRPIRDRQGELVGLSEAPSRAAVHADGAFRGAIHGQPLSSLSDSYNALPGRGLVDDAVLSPRSRVGGLEPASITARPRRRSVGRLVIPEPSLGRSYHRLVI